MRRNILKSIFFFVMFILAGGLLLTGCGENESESTDTITIGEDTYRMTFSDDFNGNKLDTKKWSLCPEWERGDVGGYWDDSMVEIDGEGNLLIKAGIRDDGTPISGAVRSAGKFEQTYGYFEACCKLQSTPGFWGAFWLMCNGAGGNVGNGAVDGAEIDIFESFSVKDSMINQALSWDGYGDDHKGDGMQVHRNVYDGEYHTFGLLWNEKGYTFYVDGEKTWSLTEDNSTDYPGSCSVPCYIKLTAEIGSWAGAFDPEKWPDQLVFDYVKVYERVDLD